MLTIRVIVRVRPLDFEESAWAAWPMRGAYAARDLPQPQLRSPINATLDLLIPYPGRHLPGLVQSRQGWSWRAPFHNTFHGLHPSASNDHIPAATHQLYYLYVPSSYCFRSFRVALRTLMIRVRSPRRQCDTNTTRCFLLEPIVISRSSSSEWAVTVMYFSQTSVVGKRAGPCRRRACSIHKSRRACQRGNVNVR